VKGDSLPLLQNGDDVGVAYALVVEVVDQVLHHEDAQYSFCEEEEKALPTWRR
jgi:hypothetical protein